MDDLEFARTVALDLTLDSREPGVQPIEEGPRSWPTQHDDDGDIWKSRLVSGNAAQRRCMKKPMTGLRERKWGKDVYMQA